MKIITLVENTTNKNVKKRHGLSFYIETKKHKILFDLGPDRTIFDNAKTLGVDLTEVDTVVISHGHKDHGGALEDFLKINHKAVIYVQRSAFLKYFTSYCGIKFYVGLDRKLVVEKQIKILDDDFFNIDDELYIYKAHGDKLLSPMNKNLYAMDKKRDTFNHEQYLFIKEKKNVLFVGCCHKGIINALDEIKDIDVDYCFGGFHTIKPMSFAKVSNEYLDNIAGVIGKTGVKFFTCHCTGVKPYQYLKSKMDNIDYISCGDSIDIE